MSGIREEMTVLLRLLRYRWAAFQFRLGYRLVGLAIRGNKDFDHEFSRMLRLYDLVGDISGFQASLPDQSEAE